jgi:hypothetical protein
LLKNLAQKKGPTSTSYRLNSDDDGRDNGSQNKISEITNFIDFVETVGEKPHMATDLTDIRLEEPNNKMTRVLGFLKN